MESIYESPDSVLEIVLHNIFHVLGVTFLFYDHLLTLDDEVNYLWKRSKNWSAYWFFLNRYVALFGNIAVTAVAFSSLQPQALLLINQVIVCILLTLRIYAVYACSLRILAFLIGCGVTLAGVACWSLFGQKSSTYQGSGCHIALSNMTSIRVASAWEALFIYDSIIFSLTVFKTYNSRKDHSITGITVPIISLILRDGAIYFAAMALANLSNIVTFYRCGPFLRGGLSIFASSLSVTMMSRLMLNLHANADIGIYSTRLSTGVELTAQCPYTTNLTELNTTSRWNPYPYDHNHLPYSTSAVDQFEGTIVEEERRPIHIP